MTVDLFIIIHFTNS